MPEAPEVFCVLQDLKPRLEGRQIQKVSITHPKLTANLPCEQFEADLTGQHFRDFHRLGKYMVFELDDFDLVVHMRMEGKFFVLDRQAFEALDPIKDRKHIHAIFLLDDGRILCYRDTRKFGRMHLYKKQEDWRALPVFDKIGKDALDPLLCAKELYEKTRRRKAPLKNVLLDQSVIAGIGNIYADEILYAAHLSPKTIASHLDLDDWQRILDATRAILNESISCKGTTIRTFSYGGSHAGSYQDQLKIHGKEGRCERCENEIVHETVGQRSTWYCPSCQKEK